MWEKLVIWQQTAKGKTTSVAPCLKELELGCEKKNWKCQSENWVLRVDSCLLMRCLLVAGPWVASEWGLVARKTKAQWKSWNFSPTPWLTGRKQEPVIELITNGWWFNQSTYKMKLLRPLNNPTMAFGELPGWWTLWGAERLASPERTWKLHTPSLPIPCSTHLTFWLFFSFTFYNKPVVISEIYSWVLWLF